MVPNKADQKA